MHDALHRRLNRLTEPHILFPMIALLLLAVIWGTTLEMLHLERTSAKRNAAELVGQVEDTYESQVVRALREIDQTLNLVKFHWAERRDDKHTLTQLRDAELLPTGMLFTVSIADRNGNIVETTHPPAPATIADQDYFQAQHQVDSFYVGALPPGANGDTLVHFSRRLSAPDGSFEGVVVIAVAADYFVSSYDPHLGEHGVLALVGLDGLIRVARVGENVFSGGKIDYGAIVRSSTDDRRAADIVRSSWDGALRWTSAQELYGFPLAVLVGLSLEEQLQSVRKQGNVFTMWAAVGSVLVVVLSAVLGRMSWHLNRARARESEARIAHARQVEYLAYHDGLTRLPNRSLFSKLLTQSIEESRAANTLFAVAFLDLDRFKQINDTLGHEAGDALLREVSDRLKSCVRDTDTVARLGGDEFVVLLRGIGGEQDAGLAAQKILAVTATPFMLLSQELRVTASIGISMYPRDGVDEQTLTKNADIAMYQAKADGKNTYQFYSERRNNSLERMTLESSLRHALERNEFRLHYQAKRDIASGRITGLEALLRWDHPDLGTVAPMRFLPVAEETGLILPIGRWVLRTACTQCVAWQKEGLPPLSIAINLTGRQFRDADLLRDIETILSSTGMNPRLLEVEVHESLLIRDIDSSMRILTQLRALGVRIALDDFGTGYSSLAMLHRFPLDTVKIDRSITREFVGRTNNLSLASNIIAMGKSLSLTVVAQGVETREQADVLRMQACDELQGFYFKRPLPAEELVKLLREQQAGSVNEEVPRSRDVSCAFAP